MSDHRTQRAQARIGQLLCGKWKVEALLGTGGMASVYAAVHRNGKRVALKMLHPELAADGDIRTRFLREGYLANKVEHNGCVSVIDDATSEDGAVFLVMELLAGETLQVRAERTGGRLPAGELVGYIDQLLDVLAAAHEKGIIHRDIKPDNLFLTSEGVIKVFDFGLARLREKSVNPTVSGSVMGTPAFMSPEQAMGKSSKQDGRTDIWSTGATMFTLLSGHLIHKAPSVTELLLMLVTRPVAPVASVYPAIHPALASVVDRALSFTPEERWPDARSMQAALRAIAPSLQGRPPSLSRPDLTSSGVTPLATPLPRSPSAPPPPASPATLPLQTLVMSPSSAAKAPAAPSPDAPAAKAPDAPAAQPAASSRPDVAFVPTAFTVPMPRFDLPSPSVEQTVVHARAPRAAARRRLGLLTVVGVSVVLLAITALFLGRGLRGNQGAPAPLPPAPAAP